MLDEANNIYRSDPEASFEICNEVEAIINNKIDSNDPSIKKLTNTQLLKRISNKITQKLSDVDVQNNTLIKKKSEDLYEKIKRFNTVDT